MVPQEKGGGGVAGGDTQVNTEHLELLTKGSWHQHRTQDRMFPSQMPQESGVLSGGSLGQRSRSFISSDPWKDAETPSFRERGGKYVPPVCPPLKHLGALRGECTPAVQSGRGTARRPEFKSTLSLL